MLWVIQKVYEWYKHFQEGPEDDLAPLIDKKDEKGKGLAYQLTHAMEFVPKLLNFDQV